MQNSRGNICSSVHVEMQHWHDHKVDGDQCYDLKFCFSSFLWPPRFVVKMLWQLVCTGSRKSWRSIADKTGAEISREPGTKAQWRCSPVRSDCNIPIGRLWNCFRGRNWLNKVAKLSTVLFWVRARHVCSPPRSWGIKHRKKLKFTMVSFENYYRCTFAVGACLQDNYPLLCE